MLLKIEAHKSHEYIFMLWPQLVETSTQLLKNQVYFHEFSMAEDSEYYNTLECRPG